MANEMMTWFSTRLAFWRIALCIACAIFPQAVRGARTLTNAAEVLALPAAEAESGIPVLVRGVVTVADANWVGQFFVQDSTAGIFVNNRNMPGPAPGDLVEVSGASYPGKYAPTITSPQWKKIGTAPLPQAKPVSIERLMSGTEDSQRVEISGIVRAAQVSGKDIGVELVSGGYRLRAFFPNSAGLDPRSLIGTKVLVRGTAAAAFNAPLRHFVTVKLFVPRAGDFIVTEAAPPNPFNDPLISLNGIAQYRKDRSTASQVHVKGIVTYQRLGEDLFLQDETGGLQVKTTLTNSVSPGDMVEAVGFPDVENYLPVLEDAVFRPLPPQRQGGVQPKPATVTELLAGLHHTDFVALRGLLIGREVKSAGQNAGKTNLQTALVLESSNVIFAAVQVACDQTGYPATIPVGSLVEASGICFLESGDDGAIKSFRLLLPSSRNVRVLEKASWLTPQHLLVSLGIAFAVLLVALGWTVMLSKKNVMLKLLVREKQAAQDELQQAHDQLEERVKERTAQLKVEMTARKESELQFRAVLTERTRLAQELHDTLEQTLTGIALQLDLVANQFDIKRDSASHHLKLARRLMRQSQEDLHRSVWGLRSRADEQFNLSNALLTSGRQITDDTGIRVEVETAGQTNSLSEIAEENLLRITQEAVTNAVKHSGANTVKIRLDLATEKVVLQVKDDGKGFSPESCSGPKDGHFGLLGIRERAERLGGQVQINSAPGMGTSIRVEIPALSPNGQKHPHPAVETT